MFAYSTCSSRPITCGSYLPNGFRSNACRCYSNERSCPKSNCCGYCLKNAQANCNFVSAVSDFDCTNALATCSNHDCMYSYCSASPKTNCPSARYARCSGGYIPNATRCLTTMPHHLSTAG